MDLKSYKMWIVRSDTESGMPDEETLNGIASEIKSHTKWFDINECYRQDYKDEWFIGDTCDRQFIRKLSKKYPDAMFCIREFSGCTLRRYEAYSNGLKWQGSRIGDLRDPDEREIVINALT